MTQPVESFTWCLHCARTFLTDIDCEQYECDYPDCDGHIGDLWDWERVRQSHPEYPVIPVFGVCYPL